MPPLVCKYFQWKQCNVVEVFNPVILHYRKRNIQIICFFRFLKCYSFKFFSCVHLKLSTYLYYKEDFDLFNFLMNCHFGELFSHICFTSTIHLFSLFYERDVSCLMWRISLTLKYYWKFIECICYVYALTKTEQNKRV